MQTRKSIILLCIILIALLFVNCTRRPSVSGTNGRNRSSDRENVRRTERTHNGSTNRGRGSGSMTKSTVKMKRENGVYVVPCKINGVEMEFIFDTGASDITISMTEAMFLYKQNKLADEDILGAEHYQIADGSVAEGTVVNLRSVTIGNRTLYNVKASIVHNMEAPLLLGQSALSEFGRISIDYKKQEIIFE